MVRVTKPAYVLASRLIVQLREKPRTITALSLNFEEFTGAESAQMVKVTLVGYADLDTEHYNAKNPEHVAALANPGWTVALGELTAGEPGTTDWVEVARTAIFTPAVHPLLHFQEVIMLVILPGGEIRQIL